MSSEILAVTCTFINMYVVVASSSNPCFIRVANVTVQESCTVRFYYFTSCLYKFFNSVFSWRKYLCTFILILEDTNYDSSAAYSSIVSHDTKNIFCRSHLTSRIQLCYWSSACRMAETFQNIFLHFSFYLWLCWHNLNRYLLFLSANIQ